MRLARFCLPLLVAGAAALPASAQQMLVPHRAVYDIVLDKASDRSGITSINGRMVYEFNGSACDGYTVNFRFVTQIDTNDVSRVTDQQTTTYEDADGDTFSFATKSFIDSSLDREVRGEARAENGETKVRLQKPDPDDISLAATRFPTQHLVELIDKAKEGETFYETSVFDGSEDADKVMTTTVVIGRPEAPAADDAESEAARAIEPETYWPVSIAYFNADETDGEEVPTYRIDFKLHDNGITRALVMDYGDFSMKGRLVDLALFEPDNGCTRAR